MFSFNRKTPGGVVLVEILIYTAILGIVGAFIGGIFTNTQRISNRQSASNEVISQLNFISQTIQRYVGNASLIDIDTSTPTSILSLRTQSETTGSTTIYLSGGTVFVREGTSAPVPISSDKVIVSRLNFTKISAQYAHDAVQIDLAINYNSANPQLSFAKSLNSVIARVSAATFDSDLVPGTDNTYNLGLSTPKTWKNAYFSGNVGIGTTAPATKLDIQNVSSPTISLADTTNNATFQMWASNSYGGLGTISNHALQIFTNNSEKIRITTEGYVGIGTTTPKGLLGLNDPAGVDSFVVGSTTPKFIIKDSGYVGIGTTTPEAILDIRSATSANAFQISNSSASNYLKFIPTWGGTNSLETDVSTYLNIKSRRLYFSTGNPLTTNVTILDDGNVGIGTTGPGQRLQISGNPTNLKISIKNTTASTGHDWTLNSASSGNFYIGDDTATENRLTIDTNGNIFDKDGYQLNQTSGTWTASESTKSNLAGTGSYGTGTWYRDGHIIRAVGSVTGYSISGANTFTQLVMEQTLPGLPNAPTVIAGTCQAYGNGFLYQGTLGDYSSSDGRLWCALQSGSVTGATYSLSWNLWYWLP